jgi:hypothetical protein
MRWPSFRIIAQRQIVCVENFSVMASGWSHPQDAGGAACPPVAKRSWGVWKGTGVMTLHIKSSQSVEQMRGHAMVWMFGSIFFIAFFAAALASSFTVVRLQQSVNGREDLPGARVAVVAGTRGEELLGAHGLQPRSYPYIIQACKALLRGEIEAVVYNNAILDYMIKDYGWRGLLQNDRGRSGGPRPMHLWGHAPG